MNRRIVGGLCALGMASALAGATAAGADPKTPPFPVVCDNGQTYQVTINGDGTYTAAHDTAGTGTFVPVSFGPFHGTIRDDHGQLVDTFTEPASEKGQSVMSLKDPLHCTYTISVVSDGTDRKLPFPAGYTLSGTGSVVGKLVASG